MKQHESGSYISRQARKTMAIVWQASYTVGQLRDVDRPASTPQTRDTDPMLDEHWAIVYVTEGVIQYVCNQKPRQS